MCTTTRGILRLSCTAFQGRSTRALRDAFALARLPPQLRCWLRLWLGCCDWVAGAACCLKLGRKHATCSGCAWHALVAAARCASSKRTAARHKAADLLLGGLRSLPLCRCTWAGRSCALTWRGLRHGQATFAFRHARATAT